MPRPKSQMSRNIREIERAKTSIESVLKHIYNVKLSYDDHKEYQERTFGKVTKHTEDTLAAIDLIAQSMGQSTTLLDLMLSDIENPAESSV